MTANTVEAIEGGSAEDDMAGWEIYVPSEFYETNSQLPEERLFSKWHSCSQ